MQQGQERMAFWWKAMTCTVRETLHLCASDGCQSLGSMQDAREDAARMKLAMGSMRRELEVVKADCDTMHALYTRLALAAWGHLAASSNVVLPPLLEAYMRKAAELQLQLDHLNGARIAPGSYPPVADTESQHSPDPWFELPAWLPQQPQQQQQEEQVQLPTCLDAC